MRTGNALMMLLGHNAEPEVPSTRMRWTKDLVGEDQEASWHMYLEPEDQRMFPAVRLWAPGKH
jgi:hypothetical protein